MKVLVISTKPIDAGRAIRLQDYVNGVWNEPVNEGNFFQFLAFMWLLARANERMMSFWKYGANPPN